MSNQRDTAGRGPILGHPQRWTLRHHQPNRRLAIAVCSLFLLGAVALLRASANQSITRDLSEDSDPCLRLVGRVKKANIRLVAFDFDATILDIHTGGRWKGTTAALAGHVRPDFACLIREALAHDVRVSVATFSTQTSLIAEVLARAVDHEEARSIPVFGDDDRVEHWEKGKQSQLLLAMNHYNRAHTQRDRPITPATTLLIDDDGDNVRTAQADGYHTILYRPGSSIYESGITPPMKPP